MKKQMLRNFQRKLHGQLTFALFCIFFIHVSSNHVDSLDISFTTFVNLRSMHCLRTITSTVQLRKVLGVLC